MPREQVGIVVSARGTEWLSGVPKADEDAGDLHTAPSDSALLAGLSAAVPQETHAELEQGAEQKPPAAVPPSSPTPCTATDEAHEPHSSSSGGSGVTADGRIILNVANIEELTRLPGIGKRRAEQIVLLRERLGKFKRVTDLLRVKGIGPKSLRQLKPLVVLDAPLEDTSGST